MSLARAAATASAEAPAVVVGTNDRRKPFKAVRMSPSVPPLTPESLVLVAPAKGEVMTVEEWVSGVGLYVLINGRGKGADGKQGEDAADKTEMTVVCKVPCGEKKMLSLSLSANSERCLLATAFDCGNWVMRKWRDVKIGAPMSECSASGRWTASVDESYQKMWGKDGCVWVPSGAGFLFDDVWDAAGRGGEFYELYGPHYPLSCYVNRTPEMCFAVRKDDFDTVSLDSLLNSLARQINNHINMNKLKNTERI